MRFCLPLPHLPVFPKASGERGFLLAGLELRQQESVSDTNLLGVPAQQAEGPQAPCQKTGSIDIPFRVTDDSDQHPRLTGS
jgi:hypothetical protein